VTLLQVTGVIYYFCSLIIVKNVLKFLVSRFNKR